MIYGYVRVSSEEQAKQGLSIQTQKETLIRNGVLEENILIDEGKSAGINEEDFTIIKDSTQYGIVFNRKKRPAFSKLLDIANSKDEIRFTKFDRLSRSIAFLEVFSMDCKKRGITLKPLEDDGSEIMRQLQGVLGQLERNKTKERNEKIERAIFDKGISPYRRVIGYDKNTKIEGKLKYPKEPEGALIIIKREAEMVKDIFDMKLQGIHYRTICDKHEIDPATYYNIIRNKIYCGYIRYQKDERKGIHTPIITEEEYNKANSK